MHRLSPARAGTWTKMLGAVAAALALVVAAPRAQETFLGQQRTFRWNEQRTGYGFDATGGPLGFEGLLSNQMPAYIYQQTIRGQTVSVPNPDLQWYFPMDVEGASLEDNEGNTFPIGYALQEIQSSPTVGSVQYGDLLTPVLTVTFGSGATVRRDIRNSLPPVGPNDPSDGRAGVYTVNGVYQADRDPYSYLHQQKTGAIFSIEAFGGTREVFESGTNIERRFKPLWWYGVRNLPWYAPNEVSLDPTNPSSDDFRQSPSQLQHRFFINASDSAMRAFDYAPSENRNPTGGFGPEPDNAEQILRRQRLFTQYLGPEPSTTDLGHNLAGPGYDTGAGWVGRGRPDLPERVTDRLYNLNITAPRFGLYANRDAILKGGNTVTPNVGPVDNRFRQVNGMGAVNSTGTLVRLPSGGSAYALTYRARHYLYQGDATDDAVADLQATRRDPSKIRETTGLQTNYLHIVGSDDGYVYAFDADPRNSRRVPESGGGALYSTHMGRLVWAFRAAVRAPLYSRVSGDTRLAATMTPAAGESPGTITTGHLDKGSDKSGIVISNGGIVTGAVTSSPVSTVIRVPSTPSILTPELAGQTRAVVYVGSGIGRLFCLDAATGQEIWEFKTTPRGQTLVQYNDGGTNRFLTLDSVAGYGIATSPTLGYVPDATSQLRPNAPFGRLAVFFGADDGKVYALDAEDGSPLREGAVAGQDGWDVNGHIEGGNAVSNMNSDRGTRYQVDHYGFVTYPFERGGKPLPSSALDGRYNAGAQYGRRASVYAKPLSASVVARPVNRQGYVEPITDGRTIPAVDMLFIASPTNQQDAAVGNDPAFTGGTLFAVDPLTARVVWTFDRWEDVTRGNNSDFDKDVTTDRFVRPGGLSITPAYATKATIFNEAKGATGYEPFNVLDDENILFVIDSAGRLFALRTDDTRASKDRMYWRVPFSLPSNTGQNGGIYSTPVVSTPNTEGDQGKPYYKATYVFIGTSDGLVAVSTTAMRSTNLTDKSGVPLPGDTRYTGGEVLWGWTTPRDVVVRDEESGSVRYDYISMPAPVVTTPAIHFGYLWAGANNGLLYAWRSTESGFGFGAAGGRIPYRGANTPRTTIPDPTGSGGATSGTSTIEFYADAFEAGFAYTPNFTPRGVRSIKPTGKPLASGNGAGVTPAPVGEAEEDFKTTTGGTLEWGDPLAVVAWGPGLDALTGNDLDGGRVTFQITGPSTTGSLQAALEKEGTQVYARQIFYLNPFGATVPTAMRYPGPLAGQQYRNPLANQIMPPGWRNQAFTLTAFYQGPDYTDANGRTRRQTQQRVKLNPSTKFMLANPLNIAAHLDGTGVKPLTVGNVKDPGKQANGSDAIRNGNERVPVVASMIGDHGTPTGLPQDTANASNFLHVADRSSLPVLRQKARGWGVDDAGLLNLVLRVRVQPRRLRWMGGPQAIYKPMLVRNTQNDLDGRPAVPNGLPMPRGSVLPPEPLYAPDWGWQRASFWDIQGNAMYVGSEQPPYLMGEENRSLDYPDIEASDSSWVVRPNEFSPTERNASSNDVMVPGMALFYLRASVPKYQPANFSPGNIDPSRSDAIGVGPGYYTVNPTNRSAPRAAILGWNPAARSNNAGAYAAFSSPDPNDANAAQRYWGPLRTDLETSNTLVAQEPNYLTKVYVDVNGNGVADVTAGEPYRMFVAGVQVRPDERLRVATTTISVPNSPETDIPGGYLPFQYYWDRQTMGAGERPGAEDEFLFGQRNLYAPFDVYNTGNVNLWSLRLSKYDPMGGHLASPDIDPAAYAGADPRSNWPGAGVIKRFNLASTLDPLPVPLGRDGAADDPTLWSPAPKPRAAAIGDEGLGQRMLVKDVFAFRLSGGALTPERARAGDRVDTPAGRPYLTVAVPPGTAPGTYATEFGRLVLFEDTGPPYARRDYNGLLDMDGFNPIEPGVNSDSVVTVRVGESRLTDKVSRYAPFLPQADWGVAMAAEPPSVSGNPSDAQLAEIWQRLAQDATPSAYRDPITGNMVVFWSSNRVGMVVPGSGFRAIAPFNADNQAASAYHIFATAMRWQDPPRPPISPTANVQDFLSNTLSKNPWGWQYQGGNMGNYFFPDFAGPARWFGQPQAGPWIPRSNTVNDALGLPPGTVDPLDLTYTSPAVITDFHGTRFPPAVFWTGSTGVGPDARSAIFYAPVRVSDTGEVTSGTIQAVGVTGGARTLDPFIQKYGPRPFLITVGGRYAPAGSRLPESWLDGEEVIGLGVAWFGGAPGAWKLYVSTIETDNSGNVSGDGRWTTRQLPLPEGVASALHPSVYYHQAPKVLSGDAARRGVLEVAFTGYSRAGRNPDIYVVRYVAARGGANWEDASIGNWSLMGFARQGGTVREAATKPLEQLIRVAGEPRPVYRSSWAAWQGRRDQGAVVYWFRKPVSPEGQPGRMDDFELVATFSSRRAGGEGLVEAPGRRANGGTLPAVTAFIDSGGGTVRFATTDPVNNPAPLSRPYVFNGALVQDFIYVSMTPYAMRVTMDDQISDTVPQIWLDETHEVITKQELTTARVSPENPLAIRRDRLWVLWRRAAQPVGGKTVSSLFYKTFRLGVDLGTPIRLVNGRPDVSVEFRDSGAVNPNAIVVDAGNGRLFFTGFNDGDEIRVTANGADLGEFTIGWVAEDSNAPARYGYGRGGGDAFRLPMGQWAEPRAVPTSEHLDDTQPWLFKDPFSDLEPGTPEYYARGNNDMWLYWASTRPSRSLGGTRSSPMEPDYWDPVLGMLMYAGSASDIYYTTLSPDFGGQ